MRVLVLMELGSYLPLWKTETYVSTTVGNLVVGLALILKIGAEL